MTHVELMYSSYIEKYEKLLLEVKNEVYQIDVKRKYFIGILLENQRYFGLNKKSRKVESIKSVKINYNKIDSIGIIAFNLHADEKIKRFLKTVFNKLILLNHSFKKKGAEIFYIKEKLKITIDIFKFTIHRSNQLNLNLVVNKGTRMSLRCGLGSLKIQKKRRYLGTRFEIENDLNRGKNVNWGLSLKKKAELIEQGILPYKATRDADGQVISDNGGEMWFVYFTSTYVYYFNWLKSSVSRDITNKFIFKPSGRMLSDVVYPAFARLTELEKESLYSK